MVAYGLRKSPLWGTHIYTRTQLTVDTRTLERTARSEPTHFYGRGSTSVLYANGLTLVCCRCPPRGQKARKLVQDRIPCGRRHEAAQLRSSWRHLTCWPITAPHPRMFGGTLQILAAAPRKAVAPPKMWKANAAHLRARISLDGGDSHDDIETCEGAGRREQVTSAKATLGSVPSLWAADCHRSTHAEVSCRFVPIGRRCRRNTRHWRRAGRSCAQRSRRPLAIGSRAYSVLTRANVIVIA